MNIAHKLLGGVNDAVMKAMEAFASDRWNLIILLLVVLNVTARLPMTPHEMGSDSFIIHAQVNNMLSTHDVSWTLTSDKINMETSIKEIYPFSEPVLTPLSLLMTSQFTSLDVEHSMLVLSILLGFIGFFTSYIMAREFVDHRLTVFLTSFLFSLSPIFLSMTSWTASSRAMFVALLPLVFWLLLKYENTRLWRYVIYAVLFSLMLMPIHRMGMLLPLVFVAFALSRIYIAFYRLIEARSSFIASYLSTILPPILLVVLLGGFGFSLLYDHPMFVQMRWNYRSGLLTEGVAPQRIVLNMLVDYWSSEGILFPFAAIGIIIVYTTLRELNRRVNERYLFLALCMILYAPTLIQGEYLTVFTLPLFSLLTALGLKGVISMIQSIVITLRLDRRITSMLFISCMLLAIAFSNLMLDHWISRIDISAIQDPNTAHRQWMQEQTYQAFLFLMNTEDKIIFADSLSQRRMGALLGDSRMAYFPDEYMTGHPRTTERVKSHIRSHEIRYVVENENIPLQYAGTERLYPSRFLESLYNQTDKIYDDGLNGIWDLGNPRAAAS